MPAGMVLKINRSLRPSIWIALALAFSSPLHAQSSLDKGTPAESKAGSSTASTYAPDKLEVVNLANGNLSIKVPVVTVGGRGSAAYTLALSYNSKLWSTQHEKEETGNDPFGSPLPYVHHYYAWYGEREMSQPNVLAFGGGWSLLLSPAIKMRRVYIDPHACTDGRNTCYKWTLTKLWLTLPDGSEVELRDQYTQGAPHYIGSSSGAPDRWRGRVWRAGDSSGATYITDADNSAVNNQLSGWVFLADGTRLRMEPDTYGISAVCTKIIDRNGNYITISRDSVNGATIYTDQLGRQTIVQGNITVKGYGGVPDRVISIDGDSIGALDSNGIASNLRADFRALPRPFTSGDYMRTAQGVFEHTIPGPHTDLFSGSESGENIDNQFVVTRVNLLDGRSLRFRYNQYGEVAEVVYPGGGISQIDYQGFQTSACEGIAPYMETLDRKVVQRRILTDGANVDAAWLYNGGNIEVRQGSSTGPLLTAESHYFLALKAEYKQCRAVQQTGDIMGDGTHYERWDNAKEYRVERQTGAGTEVTVRQWEQRAPVAYLPEPNAVYTQEQPANDPRVVWEETTLDNGKKKRTEYGYDDFNNVTSIREYDFGGTDGSLGPLVRQTFRAYATNLNGYCYTNFNPTEGTCGNEVSPDLTSIVHQRGLLLNETIKDAAGNQQAYSEVEYDNYNADANHAPVVTNAGMIQYDGTQFSSFATSYQPRGNITKATRWAGGANYVSSFSQYDNAGNVVWTKDPRGFISTVSYTDNFGDGSNPDAGALGSNGATYAFVTLATNALGQQAKSQFDYTRGVPTGGKDPNGIIAKTEYDLVGQPTRVTTALGLPEQAIAETTYPTATANVATGSRQLDATRWLASKSMLDGFDRPVTGWQAEDGQHASIASFSIRADTVYDALGRVKQTSNPYRPGAGESAIYSTTAYDLAGRVVSVTTPDNAVVNSYYDGNQVLVKDQAGKERMSRTNALGHLSDVWEITGADDATEEIVFPNRPEVTAGYRTKYEYNTLGNLITVTQRKGAAGTIQTRTFAYDPLSRLRSAINPESGTVSYSYDDNGNLLTRTDSRVPAVTTTYAYDALNRATTRTYSDSTPAVTYAYDSASIPNGRGRLASVSSSVSSYSYSGYDGLGRALSGTQTIGAQNYPIRQTYNLAGHVKTITYPSDQSVTYSYDNAGRLNSFTGNLGDETVRTYVTGITYASNGAWKREQFGTTMPLFNKRQYNNRQQLFDMRVSTVNDDMNWNRGAIVNYYSLINYYGGGTAADTNGNLYVQQHWIPNDDAISGYSMMQQNYGYDALNRINWMGEYQNGQTLTGSQSFGYDRWGNRTVSGSGTGINNKQFIVDANTNRLGVPGGQSGAMSYDNAGNLTTDTYSGSAVTRVYDAENKMTSEATYNSVVAGSYSYDGDGRRVKRVVGGTETWQVYGLGGELLAEYAANAGASSPQKEYGYRNGELLVTASVTSGWGAPPVLNDNPLQVGITTVQARHITELRDAINSLRSHLSVSAYSWQYSATPNDYISASPTLEMRTALDQALGAPSGGYAAGLAQGQPIKAIHIQELRDRVLAAWVSSGSTDIRWLVTDQLGTPRMIFDQSGSLANVSRHDYLPFGEELFAGTGGRTAVQGYGASDDVRQKFTSKERDNETGLDFFEARYYASTQGRFTSIDPYNIVMERQYATDAKKAEAQFNAYLSQPQQWNRYSYAINNPLLYIDPTGEAIQLSNDKDERARQMQALRDALKEAGAYIYENLGKDGNYYVGIYDHNPNGDSRSFEQVNEVAGEFGAIIRDQQVVALEFVERGTTVTDDSGDSRRIGRASSFCCDSPAVTGYFKGRLTIKMLDSSKNELGYLPGALMHGGQDNMLTASVMLGHELGHGRARMTGYRDKRGNAAANKASVDLENKIRRLQFPNGPTRRIH